MATAVFAVLEELHTLCSAAAAEAAHENRREGAGKAVTFAQVQLWIRNLQKRDGTP